MGPGLVPLVPFGHSRRRDDDRGVYNQSDPLRSGSGTEPSDVCGESHSQCGVES